MATKNMFYSAIPIEVEKGGTGVALHTAYGVVCAGATMPDDPFQNAGAGDSGEVLTSLGAFTIPIWATLPTFFTPLASDPASPSAGDTWYNTTDDEFRGAVTTGAPGCSWTFKANMNYGKSHAQGAGTSSDALSCGGWLHASIGVFAHTERYDLGADTWTIKTSMNRAANQGSSAGTSGADVTQFGGYPGPTANATQRYDGTGDTWTNKANMTNYRAAFGGNGSASDAMAVGSISINYTTEIYDGGADSWTSKAPITYKIRYNCVVADDTSDVLSTAEDRSTYVRTERYDGGTNTWTTKALLNQSRLSATPAGSAGNARASTGLGKLGVLRFSTEIYDGGADIWTLSCNVNTARREGSGSGKTTGSSALVFGGRGAGASNGYPTTEYTDSATVTIVTFTTT